MTHYIEWEFEDSGVDARGVCDDEDCIERYVCEHACEFVSDMRREADGSVTHGRWTESDDDPRHNMVKADSCNVVDFLNADTYMIPELTDSNGFRFVIGRTPITEVWQGEDGLTWKPRESQSADVHHEGGAK